jgi:hypothetical protein
MRARQIDFARRNFELAMNEVHQPMREIAGKVGPVIRRTVLAQPPRDIYARILLAGELDVRVRFVVA